MRVNGSRRRGNVPSGDKLNRVGPTPRTDRPAYSAAVRADAAMPRLTRIARPTSYIRALAIVGRFSRLPATAPRSHPISPSRSVTRHIGQSMLGERVTTRDASSSQSGFAIPGRHVPEYSLCGDAG